VEALTRGEVLRRIVERADLELFTDRVLDSFWEQPAFQQLHPARDDVRAWVRWNLDLVIRWLTRGEPPSEEEIAARDLLRRIAAEEPPLAEDQQLAERIGFRIDQAARPFVIAAAGRPAPHHAELAARLRRRHTLAAAITPSLSAPWTP
jgi:hypothetical protein